MISAARVAELCADGLFLVGDALDVPGEFIAECGVLVGSLAVVRVGAALCPGRIFGRLAWVLFPDACSR